MAEVGDLAAAAGMTLVSGSLPANQIDAAINQALDYIAQFAAGIRAITAGGTGANTPEGARTNLGFPAWTPLIEAGTLVSRGPDGRFAVDLATVSTHPARWDQVQSLVQALADTMDTLAGTVGGKRNTNDGSFGSTPIYTPHGRANPVSTSYVAAYLNNDGRIGASPSAARFKKNITPKVYTLADAAELGRLVVNYRLRASLYGSTDAPVEVGVLAEALIAAGFGEFVHYDADGQPFSVAYERLALVALGALTELTGELDLIAERLAALEGRQA